MPSPSHQLVFTLVLAATLLTLTSAFTCYSKELYTSKIKTVFRLAKKTDMGWPSANCLYQKGLAFTPETVEIRPGLSQECYKDTTAVKYMVAAMGDCIDHDKLYEQNRQVVARQPIQPTSPFRKVAHWLGLQETVRSSSSCYSGDHYCCIQTGIGGHDWCFDLYCGGSGRCG